MALLAPGPWSHTKPSAPTNSSRCVSLGPFPSLHTILMLFPIGEQVLLRALRKEAAWLRQALRTERQSQPQPGSDGGCPIDFPGGRQLAKDVAIAWSPAYAQAWTIAADSHGQMMQQYAPAPAVVAPTGAARWAHA